MYNSCPIETVSEIYFSFFKMDYVKLNIYVSCACFQYPSSLPFVSVRCVAFLARCYMGSLESLNVCHTLNKQTVICILWNRNAMAWKAALLKDLHRSPLPASKHLQDRQADLRQMSTPVKCLWFRGNSMRANAVYAKVVWYVYVFNMYVNKTTPQKQMHVLPYYGFGTDRDAVPSGIRYWKILCIFWALRLFCACGVYVNLFVTVLLLHLHIYFTFHQNTLHSVLEIVLSYDFYIYI